MMKEDRARNGSGRESNYHIHLRGMECRLLNRLVKAQGDVEVREGRQRKSGVFPTPHTLHALTPSHPSN
jgi:hypothetical protein